MPNNNALTTARFGIASGRELLSERAERFKRRSKAESTVRAYAFDFQHFAQWCQAAGFESLPATPQAVAEYIAWMAEEGGYRVSTIERRLSAITELHKAQDLPVPTYDYEVKQVMTGIRRTYGIGQEGKLPIRIDDIREMVEVIPDDTLSGIRDRAIILLGFSKGFRRSELAGLDVESIRFVREGMVVTMWHSKTNQEGQIERYGIGYGQNPLTCPVRNLQEWIKRAELQTGPLFRPIGRYGNIRNRRLTDHSIAIIIKTWAEKIGLDPTWYSGHSLRSGFATEAASRGVSERDIMKQTGHKTNTMVRRYIREAELFKNNASMHLGL